MTYVLLAMLSIVVSGQEQTNGKEDTEFAKQQQKKWNEFYRIEAASYSITLDGNREQVLKLRPEPVLLWSNPVRGGDTNGAVFVWTYQGRAEAVGTMFSYLARQNPSKRYVSHEFLSLAQSPLIAIGDTDTHLISRHPAVLMKPETLKNRT